MSISYKNIERATTDTQYGPNNDITMIILRNITKILILYFKITPEEQMAVN